MIEQSTSVILVIVYSFLVAIGIYAVCLYHRAYYTMHRTKMIKSVYYLLISLLIENIFFGTVALLTNIGSIWANYLALPVCWAIPKLLLLGATIYFVYTSLSPSDFRPDDCVCKICGQKLKSERKKENERIC